GLAGDVDGVRQGLLTEDRPVQGHENGVKHGSLRAWRPGEAHGVVLAATRSIAKRVPRGRRTGETLETVGIAVGTDDSHEERGTLTPTAPAGVCQKESRDGRPRHRAERNPLQRRCRRNGPHYNRGYLGRSLLSGVRSRSLPCCDADPRDPS